MSRELPPLRAMVLAAGAGTRLRPLTHEVPKPMVPVANRPVLHHVLDNLARHGVRDAVLNLHSLPEQVRKYCGDGKRWGMRIRYSRERQLLGTAGALKKAARHFRGGPVLVMSGDGLSDVDLTALHRFHRSRRSAATMVTTAADARFDYGVTLAAKDGRITGFREKPRWSEVFSNRVNTGIYLLEPEIVSLIPDGVYDFGHQLWPRLLTLRKPVYAWDWEGYWCDVGNLTEYRKAQKAALDEQTRVSIPGLQIKPQVWVDETARVHPRAVLEAPCAVGAGARLEAGCRVGPYTVVGAGARVGAGAVLKNSILFDGASVGGGAYLDNCILGAGVRADPQVAAYDAEFLNKRA